MPKVTTYGEHGASVCVPASFGRGAAAFALWEVARSTRATLSLPLCQMQDIVLCWRSDATAATATCAHSGEAVVSFWQQNGEQMMLETHEDGGRNTATVTPSTSPSTGVVPELFISPMGSDETNLNVANWRVALERAVDSGDVDESAVRTILLQVAAHASDSGDIGETPLHLAAALGQERIVTLLLRQGADANALDGNGRTPLHLAVERGHLCTAKAILAANPDTSIRYKVACRGYSVLDLAAREGNVGILRALLQHGVDVNRLTDGYTSLHVAALNNHVGAIDVLVEAGADMEVEDDDECTPFLDAVLNHCHEAALALFRHGANIEARDFRGETPLQIAARQAGREGVAAIVNLLLTCGSDETAVNPDGRTAAEIVGHHIEYAACPLKKEDVHRVRELLANAPADRAWRRRGFVVLCKARFLRAKSSRSISVKPSNSKALHDDRVSGSSGDAWLGARERRQEQGERLLGGHMAEDQVHKVAPDDAFRSAVVRVMELSEEGLFRNIVGFL